LGYSQCMAEDSITINLPPSLRDRSRGKKAGTKAKISIEIESDPIMALMDVTEVEGAAAEAVAAELKRRVRAVTETVSDATKERRARYQREWQAGKKRAVRRFRGSSRSKLPATPPKPGADRWLNDSGRLADGLKATFNPRAGEAGGWTVNVAENRLNAPDFGPAHFQHFSEQFDRLVLRGRPVTDTAEYHRAVAAALPSMLVKLQAMNRQKKAELMRAYGKLVSGTIRALL
jgi:hypothetical protein